MEAEKIHHFEHPADNIEDLTLYVTSIYDVILCSIIKNACDAYKSINHLLNQAEKKKQP